MRTNRLLAASLRGAEPARDDLSWFWPDAGPTPVTQGTDSEMFDTLNIPFSETVIREAIQNSLDARTDNSSEPVDIRFSFHQQTGDPLKFINQIVEHRRTAGLTVPEEFDRGIVRWLNVEDFNAKGLEGDLESRTSDFWNYWLNFGLSNKRQKNRGGRGIGRVTFLISSQLNAVLGHTVRASDGVTASCGMAVLRAGQYGSHFKSTHAFLADEPSNSTYRLHKADGFDNDLVETFALSRRTGPDGSGSGLSLVIPYPHEELTPEGMLASALEHFAPAIRKGILRISVDDVTLNRMNMVEVAERVKEHFNDKCLRDDPVRYLELLDSVMIAPTTTIELNSCARATLSEYKDSTELDTIRQLLDSGETAVFGVSFPLKFNDGHVQTSITVALRQTSPARFAIDKLYREGMCLPDVSTRRRLDMDMLIMADEVHLSSYLNLCEGKAHLDLLESVEIRGKLKERGFSPGFAEKRLIKRLQEDLRKLVQTECAEPDARVFVDFFPKPEAAGKPVPKPPKKPGMDKELIEQPDKPNRVPLAIVDTLSDGLRIRPHPDRGGPIHLRLVAAYADGSRRPGWSVHDFVYSNLNISAENCQLQADENKLYIKNFGSDSAVEIRGFDTNRELDTRFQQLKVSSDA